MKQITASLETNSKAFQKVVLGKYPEKVFGQIWLQVALMIKMKNILFCSTTPNPSGYYCSLPKQKIR